MTDNKKNTGKTKGDPSPIQEPVNGDWNRVKNGEAQFDIKVSPKGGGIAFADHTRQMMQDEPLSTEDAIAYTLEEIEAYKQLNEIMQKEAATIMEQADRLKQLSVTPESLSEWKDALSKFVEALSTSWRDYFDLISSNIAIDPGIVNSMQSLLDSIANNDYLRTALEEYRQLEPYIQAELEKRGVDSLQELSEAEVRELEAAAREAMAAADITSVTVHRPDSLAFPLDRISRDLFSNLIAETAKKGTVPGQIVFDVALDVAAKKDKKERSILYSIQFNDIYDTATISKALTQFDRRVYDAVSSLYAAGNSYMTLAQIHSMMGNTTRPNATQRQKINDSLDKMASAWITLDQSQDYPEYINASKGKLGLKYNGQLIYMETLEANINGKMAEKAIHIIKEPVLHKMAIDRGQITAIPRAVLETGKSQNEDYLNLENYVLDRISQMRNHKRQSSKKIKYSSLYEALGITGSTDSIKTKRTRTKKKLFELLEHYKAKKWIKGFKDDGTGEPGVQIDC